MSCHDYQGVMLVLSTPLQVKCYQLCIPCFLNQTAGKVCNL